MIRKNRMKHLIKLVKNGVVSASITDAEIKYLKKRGFKVEKDKYSIFGLYHIKQGGLK